MVCAAFGISILGVLPSRSSAGRQHLSELRVCACLCVAPYAQQAAAPGNQDMASTGWQCCCVASLTAAALVDQRHFGVRLLLSKLTSPNWRKRLACGGDLLPCQLVQIECPDIVQVTTTWTTRCSCVTKSLSLLVELSTGCA